MAKRPRLMVVIPTLGGGGLERLTLDLAAEWVAAGADIEIVALTAAGELADQVPAGVALTNLGVSRLRSALWPLRRHIARRQPHAILASMWPLSAIVLAAAWLSGARPRVFAWEHVNLSHSRAIRGASRLMLRRVGRAIYRASSGVICVSKGVGEDLATLTGLGPDRLHVIHNAVRQPGGKPPRADPALLGWWRDGRQLIAIGRLTEQKDFETLLKAMPGIEGAHLLILGDGPKRPELEALVRDLGLQERVRMPGFAPDVYAWLPHAELFVLSSRWEGFGNVIIEALVHGVPVVATDCPSGPAEILDEGRFGRLVPPGDTVALTRAIVAALDSAHDCNALRGRGAEFNPHDVARRYAERLGLEGLHWRR